MNLPRIILYFLLGILVAQFLYYFVNLPETVAVHYNFSGAPDYWLTKNSFAIAELFILLLIVSLFTIVSLILEKSPESLINLPNKQFWLATERRRETFEYIAQSFDWLALILTALMIALNQLIFRANILAQNISFAELASVLAILLTTIIVWLLKFRSHFNKL